MLILSRKVNEAIVIDNDICITVLRTLGGKVRLGIEAPRSKHVLRRELGEIDETAQPSPPRQARRSIH